jgi:hypothetical protein
MTLLWRHSLVLNVAASQKVWRYRWQLCQCTPLIGLAPTADKEHLDTVSPAKRVYENTLRRDIPFLCRSPMSVALSYWPEYLRAPERLLSTETPSRHMQHAVT